MQGGSRIVLDLSKPVRIDKAFVLDAAEGQPARLVLDLVATDRDTLHALARARQQAAARAADAPQIRAAIRRPRAIRGRSSWSIPAMAASTTAPGAAGGDITEKAIVLDFALLLRDQLEKTGKYRVVMTRTDDSFVPLGERVRWRGSRQAALFISIHADALRQGRGRRAGRDRSTRCPTTPPTPRRRGSPRRENRADVIAGIDLSHEPGDVADILIDLAQRETKTFSMHFAKTLVGELKKRRAHAQASAEVGGLQGAARRPTCPRC